MCALRQMCVVCIGRVERDAARYSLLECASKRARGLLGAAEHMRARVEADAGAL